MLSVVSTCSAKVQVRAFLKRRVFDLWRRSIEIAVREQGLGDLVAKVEKIFPDLSEIRSNYQVDSPYLVTCYRALDAFQVSLVQQVINEFDTLRVVDVGDSSGRHLLYVMALRAGKETECVSVNADPVAVERVKRKGIRAVCGRAERIREHLSGPIDVVLCFETLEHLTDPSTFLKELSYRTDAKYLIATVPYVRRSRVGLWHIRKNRGELVNAENTHVFELSPGDWKLLMRHSGWEVVKERIYYQYPKRSIYRAVKWLWRRYDFEGYLGLILARDHSYSDRYQDWLTVSQG